MTRKTLTLTMTLGGDNPARSLCAVFGGGRALARAIGVDQALISRWCSSTLPAAKHGRVPPSYNQRILEAADKEGIERADVEGFLQANVCPTCGREMEAKG